jgi:hypothetical protein
VTRVLAPRRDCAPSMPRAGASGRPLNFTVRQHAEERRTGHAGVDRTVVRPL